MTILSGPMARLCLWKASPLTWGASILRPMYKLTFDKIYRNTIFQGGRYCDFGVRRAADIDRAAVGEKNWTARARRPLPPERL